MTTVKNVLAVPAGHYLVREADGRQKLVQYYEPMEFFNIMTSDVINIDNILGRRTSKKSFPEPAPFLKILFVVT